MRRCIRCLFPPHYHSIITFAPSTTFRATTSVGFALLTRGSTQLVITGAAASMKLNVMMERPASKVSPVPCIDISYCGCPIALHLSGLGHDGVIVENLSSRKIYLELGSTSLTRIQSIPDRVGAWRAVSQRDVRFVLMELYAEQDRLLDLIVREKPGAVVYFVEQRAEP